MKLINAIKNFFSGGDKLQQFTNVNQSTLLTLYDDFLMSERYKWMKTGTDYYDGKQEILEREIGYWDNDTFVCDETQPNNKVIFNYAKFISDQKVDYSLSKDPTLESDNEQYQSLLETMLSNNDFLYNLNVSGLESSNSGTAWWHPYVDAKGEFKFIIVPANQCVPIWKDDLHTELSAMVRVYNTLEDNSLANPVQSTIYEYWTETGMMKFKSADSNLIQLNDTNLLQTIDGNYTGETAHFISKNLLRAWGKVPFIPFKNNMKEQPDIQEFKTILDAMNLTMSDLINALEQERDRLITLENAGGTTMQELIYNIKRYGVVKTNNIDGSGSKINVSNLPASAVAPLSAFNTLKSALMEIAHAANTNQDWKVPPAGIALQLLYRELDIKCNKFELQYKRGIKELQFFFITYLNLVTNTNFSSADIAKITFNRDMVQNVQDSLNQLHESVKYGTMSKETAVKKNPLVDDPEEEFKKVKQEHQDRMKEESKGYFDSIPMA